MNWRSLHRLLIVSSCSICLAGHSPLLFADQPSNITRKRTSEIRYDSLASWSDGFLKIRVEKNHLSTGYRLRIESGSHQGKASPALEIQSSGSVHLTGASVSKSSIPLLSSVIRREVNKPNFLLLYMKDHSVRNRGNLRLGLDELITEISIIPADTGTLMLCNLSSSHRFEAYWDDSTQTLWIEPTMTPSPKFSPASGSASPETPMAVPPPQVVRARHIKIRLPNVNPSIPPEAPVQEAPIKLIKADILEPELPPVERKEEPENKELRSLPAQTVEHKTKDAPNPLTEVEGPLLREIELDRDSHNALVFSMNDWPEYRLRKVQDGLFYLKILKARVSDSSLLLPRFAPSSNTALKMVTAKSEKDGLSIEIYTESGVELSSKVVDDDIWIQY